MVTPITNILKRFLAAFLIIAVCATCPLSADDPFNDFDFDFEPIAPVDPNEVIVSTLRTIVTKPLWGKTNIPNGRDVLYFMPYKMTALQKGGVITNLFFNSTNKMPLTFDEVFNAEGINVALDGIVHLLSSSHNIEDVISITPLLRKITLQERKIGALFQAGITQGPFIFQLNTSFIVCERNFWLSERDRNEIVNTVAHYFPGPNALKEREFVRWKVGLGDTRLKIGLNIINLNAFQIDVGLEGIIPTSKISSSGKLNREVSHDPNEFLTVLMRNLQQMVLEPRLGNGGHFGLGVYIESKLSFWDDQMALWNRISFDNFFQGKEERLILFRNTIKPDQLTVDNLPQFLKQYIFPPVFGVDVQPGNIVNFVAGYDVGFGDFRLGLGYDFYFAREEQFEHIYDAPPVEELLISKAVASSAMQHKVFSEVLYTKKFKRVDLTVGWGGDITIHNHKIGKDWTVYSKIGVLF